MIRPCWSTVTRRCRRRGGRNNGYVLTFTDQDSAVEFQSYLTKSGYHIQSALGVLHNNGKTEFRITVKPNVPIANRYQVGRDGNIYEGDRLVAKLPPGPHRDADAKRIIAGPMLAKVSANIDALWRVHGFGDNEDESGPIWQELQRAINVYEGVPAIENGQTSK